MKGRELYEGEQEGQQRGPAKKTGPVMGCSIAWWRGNNVQAEVTL